MNALRIPMACMLALVAGTGCVVSGRRLANETEPGLVQAGWQEAIDPAPLEPAAADLGSQHPGIDPLLSEYLGRALGENRAVQAARFDVMALRARIPQATALEDPMVQNGMWPFPSNAPQYSLMGYMPYEMMITQQFPWLGTLRLRGLVAEEELKATVWALASAQLAVASEVKRAYYALWSSERRMAILAENRELAEEIVPLTLTRLEGGGSLQDVLRAEVAVAELERELTVAEQDVVEARAPLAELLHLDPQSDLHTSAQAPSTDGPALVEPLYHLAVQARPELQARLAEIARDQHEVKLARKRFYPNFTVGVGYATMTRINSPSLVADGRDNVGFILGFNLPIYRGKLEAGLCEAKARVQASTRRYEAERDRSLREVSELFAQVKAQRATLALLRDRIAPKSRQALESAVAGYRAGNLDYVTLNSARQELLEVDLQTVETEAALARLLAALERAIGMGLVSLEAAPASEPLAAPIEPSETRKPTDR